GRVNDFIGLLQPVYQAQAEVLRVGSPDKGLAPLVNDVADRAGEGIDLDHAEALMPPVGLLIHEPAPVLLPMQAWREPLMLEAVHYRFDLFLAAHVKKI